MREGPTELVPEPERLGEAAGDAARIAADQPHRADGEERDREEREECPHRDGRGQRATADLRAPTLDRDVDRDEVGHAVPERHVTYGDTVHALATGLLVAAGLSAVGNWIAVARGSTIGIYVCKPLTLVLMVASAVALDPTNDATRAWFVVALVLSLLGDVFLMLPSDAFVPGLGSFLLAHVAYVVGLNQDGDGRWWLAVPVVLVAVVLGRRLVAGIRGSGHPEMVPPVVAYVVTILVMVASAVASGDALAAAGALLFMTSDALIGEQRFVTERAWQPLVIIVTYHVAQALLVLSLT